MSDIVTPWGPLGLITYKRTYARTDDSGIQENFTDTVDRILRGAQEQLKCGFTPDELNRLRNYMLQLKGLPAGRFLWQLGTSTVDKLGMMSLMNCNFTSINKPIEPFTWAFDSLMLGNGVGYSVQREHVYELPKVRHATITRRDTKDADFLVPDSREGWVELLRRVLESHFKTGKSFSYSTICIRGKGTPIKGFGGQASGPDPLAWGIDHISLTLNARSGKKIRSIDALDIMNIIGYIVVSGNVRRCLPKGSLVSTSLGLVPIEKVSPGMEVLTDSGAFHKVVNFFEQGKQSLLTIKTQDGSFSCTPNHKMAVLTGADGSFVWKEASKLISGDRLVGQRYSISGTKTSLPSFSYEKPEHSTTCKDITIPELTPEIAWLIGLFQADGYTYPNYERNGFNAYVSIVVGLNELEIAQKAQEQLQKFGSDLQVSLKKRKDENSYIVHCQSKQLAWYFDKNVKQANKIIEVPEYILTGTKDIRLAYVAGVSDGDGSLSNRPVIVTSSVYLPWVKQLQIVLYSCGIESRLKEQAEEIPSRVGWQKIHTLSLITTRSRNLFAEVPELMKEVRKSSNSQRANGVPSSWIYDSYIKRKYGLYQASQMNIDSLDSELGDRNFLPIEVIDIQEGVGEEETFDIEVEQAHNFFCNGYLTHNSAQIALGDYDDELFIKAKRWDLGTVPNWRAMSNNTVICSDTSKLPQAFWDSYTVGGEPIGIFNKKLSQSVGRTGATEYPDPMVMGTNPCSEISLSNWETCCLSELFLSNIHSKEELFDVATLLYRINKHAQTLPSHQKKTEDVNRKNMRVGLGVTGYLQATDEQKGWLDDCYTHLREFDSTYSMANKFVPSIKLTTIKPSGTLSLLAGTTSGCHPGFSQYYIRRIRIASNSPLAGSCRSHGYPVEFQKKFDGSLDYETVVVEFPCAHPVGTILAKDLTAVQQMDIVRRLQREWADNAVSCTVYFKKEELPEIQEYLAKYYKDEIKSISFLLHSEHGFVQAPLEEISYEEYERRILTALPISDATLQMSDVELDECLQGHCPVR